MKRGCWLRLLFSLILLVAAAVALAPLIPLGPLKPAVEAKLSAALGRQVTAGSVRLSLLGGPYVVIKQMTAREAPAFGAGNFLEADEVRADLALLPLVLRRQVVIEGLSLRSPRFTFVKNDQGIWSWATLSQGGTAAHAPHPRAAMAGAWPSIFLPLPAAQPAITPAAALNDIRISGASVRLIDQSGVQPPESLYRNIDLRASISRQSATHRRAAGALSVQSEEGDGASLLRAEMPFDLTMESGSPAALAVQGTLGPGRLETANLAASDFKSDLNIKGNTAVFDPLDMSLAGGALRGRLELNLTDQRFTSEGRVENLDFDQALASKLQMPGQITGRVHADFKLGGSMVGFQQAIQTVTGEGRMSSDNLFVAGVNLSEQVARALKIAQIGDMSPGTGIGGLEADFSINQGVVRTSNLRIRQLDGLGEAVSEQGWLSAAAAPTLGYQAAVTLSPEATATAKRSSPLLGAVITVFETNNRITVPVSITGDVRHPSIQVDVRRLLQP